MDHSERLEWRQIFAKPSSGVILLVLDVVVTAVRGLYTACERQAMGEGSRKESVMKGPSSSVRFRVSRRINLVVELYSGMQLPERSIVASRPGHAGRS